MTDHVGIIGAGKLGQAMARTSLRAGRRVVIANSRGPESLASVVSELGDGASAGTVDEVASAGMIVLAVPWDGWDDAVSAAGSLDGKIVIDTTNQYGSTEMPADGETGASFHAARADGAPYTKSFNTLTSSFQAEAAFRPEAERIVQWVCGDDEAAKQVVMELIADAGYAPIDLGANADAAVMEAPRRPGAVYGEEYRLADAEKVVEAVRADEEIPPTPSYS